ncbi:type III-A CRISPR-associated RAMP protein Csm4 (plasmid) [Nostoc sp. UHCC 0302]|uniref:type III-A CRISPR-associated RAMP protein Csm4 n=1 Tax=Nostoc sp. UHCC 0302 TaxID=3134896 RepID=UPI00311CCF5D
MSIWKLVKLKFGRNVAHFGELGIGMEETSERVLSDTLFSAWVSSYSKLFGKDATTNFLEKFNSQPEPLFRLSSTFIFHSTGENTTYYLPCPLKFPPNYPVGNDLNFIKAYKSLKYLPLDIWQRWYQGNGFSDGEELEAKIKGEAKGVLNQKGTFKYNEAFKINKVPKIAVDRVTRATNIYSTGFVQYQWEGSQKESDEFESLSGLYFLVRFAEPDLENIFFAVLDFMGGEGIGGERSSGAGHFETQQTELTDIWKQVLDFKDTNHHCLISLFWQHPLPKEILDDASYELQQRGGWLASPVSDGRQLRRKSVQMFTEGSVFSIAPQGQLADVTPDKIGKFLDHKVYRSGISLSLTIKAQEE